MSELKVGDYVVAMVRCAGSSIYDQIGSPDMTTDEVYRERGISQRHGFLTEYFVDSADYLGNRVMVGTVNAGREHVEAGVRDLTHAESQYPGWLSRLITDRVDGLHNYAELFQRLEGGDRTIKVVCEI